MLSEAQAIARGTIQDRVSRTLAGALDPPAKTKMSPTSSRSSVAAATVPSGATSTPSADQDTGKCSSSERSVRLSRVSEVTRSAATMLLPSGAKSRSFTNPWRSAEVRTTGVPDAVSYTTIGPELMAPSAATSVSGAAGSVWTAGGEDQSAPAESFRETVGVGVVRSTEPRSESQFSP